VTGTVDGAEAARDLGQTDEMVNSSLVGVPTRVHAAVDRSYHRGELVARRYRVEALLGRGGMSEVYRVLDLELGLRVALKTINPGREERARDVARLKRELCLARRVAHPHVRPIYDVGQHVDERGARRTFVTMAYLHGEPLADHMARAGAWPVARALPLLAQIASALDALHRARVVHRDLKPSNVMIVGEGPAERAVVTDFGIAAPLGATSGDDHGLERAGSPSYMAPEQRRGQRGVPATDVYAFGVLAHELLTGARPTSPGARRTARLDPEWDALFAGCLAERVEDRFASAGEALGCLSRVRLARRVCLTFDALVFGLATGVLLVGGGW
jgi:serine/threonine-protein kinase